MRNEQIGRAKSIPANLTKYIHLNRKYHVLVCVGCGKAVRPYELVGHLEQFHGLGVGRVGNRLRQYIKAFKHDYEPATVENPADWSAPQAKLGVICGWLCKECGFRSKSRGRVRGHGYKKHGLERASVDTIIVEVRLQTWFDRPPRYWVINDAEVETGGRATGQTQARRRTARRSRQTVA